MCPLSLPLFPLFCLPSLPPSTPRDPSGQKTENLWEVRGGWSWQAAPAGMKTPWWIPVPQLRGCILKFAILKLKRSFASQKGVPYFFEMEPCFRYTF